MWPRQILRGQGLWPFPVISPSRLLRAHKHCGFAMHLMPKGSRKLKTKQILSASELFGSLQLWKMRLTFLAHFQPELWVKRKTCQAHADTGAKLNGCV